MIVNPTHFSLARVSVCRLNGECFLDDYVVAREPIVDYLTRYSGIVPGDLEPAVRPRCAALARRLTARSPDVAAPVDDVEARVQVRRAGGGRRRLTARRDSKLRWLVERGCRFLGHGLEKDFRIINMAPHPAKCGRRRGGGGGAR